MKFSNIFLLFILLNFSCAKWNKESITIYMINEMQECEEDNLHFRILSLSNSGSHFLIDKIVLPVLDSSIDTPENRECLFPFPSTYRKQFKVEGYYSRKPHSGLSDGCIGTHAFKVVSILDEVILDESYSFPINNH